MRDTIRGIVGKLRKGVNGYILVAVDLVDYSVHSYDCRHYGERYDLYGKHDMISVGWYHDPIKMTELRRQIESKIKSVMEDI